MLYSSEVQNIILDISTLHYVNSNLFNLTGMFFCIFAFLCFQKGAANNRTSVHHNGISEATRTQLTLITTSKTTFPFASLSTTQEQPNIKYRGKIILRRLYHTMLNVMRPKQKPNQSGNERYRRRRSINIQYQANKLHKWFFPLKLLLLRCQC